MNSRTASDAFSSARSTVSSGSRVGNGSTRQTTSPSISSGSLLVERMTRLGQRSDSVWAKAATASRRCSQLSRMSNADLLPRAEASTSSVL